MFLLLLFINFGSGRGPPLLTGLPPGKGGLGCVLFFSFLILFWHDTLSTAGKLGKVSPAGHGPFWEEERGVDPSAGSSVKRESDLLYEKWITRKQERERREGEEEQRRKTTKLWKKNSTGKEREGFERKNAEIGKWKPKKNGTECEWGEENGTYINTREGIKTIFKTTFILF